MQVAITTFDNPYNPFNDFVSWFLFDQQKGYGTCSYLARISNTSDFLTEEEEDEEVERAIDEIIKFDPFNMYRKVKPSDYTDGSFKTNKIEALSG